MTLSTPNDEVDIQCAHVSKMTWGKVIFNDSLVDFLFGGGTGVQLIMGHPLLIDNLPQLIYCILGYTTVRGHLCIGKLFGKRGWKWESSVLLYF